MTSLLVSAGFGYTDLDIATPGIGALTPWFPGASPHHRSVGRDYNVSLDEPIWHPAATPDAT